MSVVLAVFLSIVVGILAWIAYVAVGTMRTVTAEVTKLLGRFTANEPIEPVNDAGIPATTAEMLQAVLEHGIPGGDVTYEGPGYVDPTDLDLPDPAEYEAANRVVMGHDPTWPKFDD